MPPATQSTQAAPLAAAAAGAERRARAGPKRRRLRVTQELGEEACAWSEGIHGTAGRPAVPSGGCPYFRWWVTVGARPTGARRLSLPTRLGGDRWMGRLLLRGKAGGMRIAEGLPKHSLPRGVVCAESPFCLVTEAAELGFHPSLVQLSLWNRLQKFILRKALRSCRVF